MLQHRFLLKVKGKCFLSLVFRLMPNKLPALIWGFALKKASKQTQQNALL